jgi:arylsulfatase A-like enzyme
MEGTSLKKAMHANSINNGPKFSMTTYTDPRNSRSAGTTIAVIRDTFKYVYSTNQEKGELYNLERDPKEFNNVAEVEKERAIKMKSFIFEKIIKKDRNG